MSEPLYRIEEMQTDGWKEPDQYCTNLTKEQAKMVASCNAVHRDISLNF